MNWKWEKERALSLKLFKYFMYFFANSMDLFYFFFSCDTFSVSIDRNMYLLSNSTIQQSTPSSFILMYQSNWTIFAFLIAMVVHHLFILFPLQYLESTKMNDSIRHTFLFFLQLLQFILTVEHIFHKANKKQKRKLFLVWLDGRWTMNVANSDCFNVFCYAADDVLGISKISLPYLNSYACSSFQFKINCNVSFYRFFLLKCLGFCIRIPLTLWTTF